MTKDRTASFTDQQPSGQPVSRREVLARIGVVGLAGAAALGGWSSAEAVTKKRAATTKKTTKKAATTNAAATNAATTNAAAASGGGSALACTLTPEMTEGPFYLDLNKVRSDITEGRPGAPLALTLTVANATTCAPIPGAVVDIWHTDALGTYSGVSGNSGTFMRGTQIADAHGVVKFATVYPGWYQGRTVHIHVKVHVGGSEVHTGQLFFDDAITDAAYKAAPYNARGARTTRNAADGIYQGGGSASLLAPAPAGSGYTAAMTMGVRS